MKKILREEILRQKKLMNLQEQNQSWGDALYDYMSSGLKSIFFGDDDEDEKKPKKLEDKIGSFEKIAGQLIDEIEGGYFHPIMVKGGRGFPKGSRSMGDSGETMFGIDRKHGAEINTSSEGRQFWGLIDAVNASKKWPWLYKGGNLEGPLKNLASRMIKNNFNKFADRYLTPEAKKVVQSDEGLLTHFIYATWNGPGWFNRFAKSINSQVEKGVTDTEKLMKIGLQDRKNSGNNLISSSAEKIEKIRGTNLV
jgi:hypothetical protein